MPNKHAGFTLVELLVSLSIVAILGSFAMPSMYQAYQKQIARSAIDSLSHTISFARQTAINESMVTTICPSLDQETCQGDWHDGLIVFVDENLNAKRESTELLLVDQRPFLESGTLSYNASKSFLQFSTAGFPKGTFGSFVYCPETSDMTFQRKLTLNLQGKVTISSPPPGSPFKCM